MKDIKIKMGSLGLVFMLLGLWSCNSGPKPENNQRPVTSDKPNPNAVKMPDFKFTTLDGKPFTRKDLNKQKAVFFFFSSLCEHCKKTAKHLVQRADELKDVQVILFSTEKDVSMKVFRKDNGLDKFPNYQFMHIDNKDVFKNFGAVQVPSAFIYNRHQELVQKIIGRTFFDFIIDNIPA